MMRSADRWRRSFPAVLLLLALGSCEGSGFESRESENAFIRKAVFAEGKVWLLNDNGQVSSITPNGRSRRVDDLGRPVLDLCSANGRLLAITRSGSPARWTFRTTRPAGRWSAGLEVPVGKEEGLEALLCIGQSTTLVSSDRLITVDDRKVWSVPLKGKLRGGLTSAAHATREHVFLGFNAGEWGGGIQRIDRATGVVTSVERNISGELCGGPLNKDCDPVHAIVDSPWREGCIVAAVGLLHMLPHGRLVEICGDDIHSIYTKAYDAGLPDIDERSDGEPRSSVAFFGLVRSGSGLLAAGMDGLYRFTAPGEAKLTQFPVMKSIDGVRLSFRHPGTVMVLSEIHRRKSLGGAAPMLIERRAN